MNPSAVLIADAWIARPSTAKVFDRPDLAESHSTQTFGRMTIAPRGTGVLVAAKVAGIEVDDDGAADPL